MTENRGAYINIGPDYKLKFCQFDAVPHPNIKPMVSLLLPQCVALAIPLRLTTPSRPMLIVP